MVCVDKVKCKPLDIVATNAKQDTIQYDGIE